MSINTAPYWKNQYLQEQRKLDAIDYARNKIINPSKEFVYQNSAQGRVPLQWKNTEKFNRTIDMGETPESSIDWRKSSDINSKDAKQSWLVNEAANTEIVKGKTPWLQGATKGAGIARGTTMFALPIVGFEAGQKVTEAIGAEKNGTGALLGGGVGSTLGYMGAAKLVTGALPGWGKIAGVALTSLIPAGISLFTDDKKERTYQDIVDEYRMRNPKVDPEIIGSQMDQLKNKVKDSQQKLQEVEQGFTMDLIDPNGKVNMEQAQRKVLEYKAAKASADADSVIAGFYLQAGMQGALDMVQKNGMLSNQFYQDIYGMTSAMDAAVKGDRNARGYINEKLGNLPSIMQHNKDAAEQFMMYTNQKNKEDAMKMDYMLKAMDIQSKTELAKQKSSAKETKPNDAQFSQIRQLYQNDLYQLNKIKGDLDPKKYNKEYLAIKAKYEPILNSVPGYEDMLEEE